MAEQHEKALVPQIRFTGFTDPWEQRKLGQHLKLSRELGHTGVDARKLTVKLWGKGVVEKTDLYGGSAQTQYYIRHAGQFMYGKLDFLHAAFGVVPDKLDCFESTLDSPAFDIEGLDSSFLLNLVTQEDFYLKNGNIANGSRKAKRIHEETFLNMEIRAPELVEQRRIGAFLDRLDSLITLHQRKYDKLCVLKKSMLDKMFPKGGSLYPEIRFAGFTDPWEQRKLSDLTDRVSIQSSDSDLPQVEYEDIIPGEGTLNKDLRDKKGGKTGIKFYAGDVLYGKLRPYLMNWLYPQFNGVAVGDFWVLRATECDSSFLYRLVQTGSFQRLANVSSGSKMPRADWNLISQSFFAVPADHAEQKAIAKGLAELDTLITLHQRKYDGCANPLFSERRISCRKPSHQNRCSATTTPSG